MYPYRNTSYSLYGRLPVCTLRGDHFRPGWLPTDTPSDLFFFSEISPGSYSHLLSQCLRLIFPSSIPLDSISLFREIPRDLEMSETSVGDFPLLSLSTLFIKSLWDADVTHVSSVVTFRFPSRSIHPFRESPDMTNFVLLGDFWVRPIVPLYSSGFIILHSDLDLYILCRSF